MVVARKPSRTQPSGKLTVESSLHQGSNKAPSSLAFLSRVGLPPPKQATRATALFKLLAWS